MVANISIRIATPEESAAAKGSWLYQRGATLLEGYYAKWTIENKLANQEDLLKWRAPLSQRVAEYALYWMGRNPDYPAVSVHYGQARSYTLWNKQVIEEFFKHHRNDPEDFFKPTPSMVLIANTVREIFPECTLTEEDVLLTCSPDQTRLFHHLLESKLNRKSIRALHPQMIEISDEAIGMMAASSTPVDMQSIAEQYCADVMGLILFRQRGIGKELGDSLGSFKDYLFKVFSQTASPDDKIQVSASLDNFKEKLSEWMPESDLSSPQKQALLLVTLFFAHSMSATLLTALFAHLSKQWYSRNSKMQQEAVNFYAKKDPSPFQFPETIESFYEEVLRTYPPAPMVARTAAQDLMVGGTLIPKGSLVSARVLAVQERFFGENGPHSCPGKDLVKVQVLTFFTRFIEMYNASYKGRQNYHLALQFTGVIQPPVLIKPKLNEVAGYPARKVHPD